MKFDKTGALVRKYIPELRNFPDKVSISSCTTQIIPTLIEIKVYL